LGEAEEMEAVVVEAEEEAMGDAEGGEEEEEDLEMKDPQIRLLVRFCSP
jgi:hypothetical protein